MDICSASMGTYQYTYILYTHTHTYIYIYIYIACFSHVAGQCHPSTTSWARPWLLQTLLWRLIWKRGIVCDDPTEPTACLRLHQRHGCVAQHQWCGRLPPIYDVWSVSHPRRRYLNLNGILHTNFRGVACLVCVLPVSMCTCSESGVWMEGLFSPSEWDDDLRSTMEQ